MGKDLEKSWRQALDKVTSGLESRKSWEERREQSGWYFAFSGIV